MEIMHKKPLSDLNMTNQEFKLIIKRVDIKPDKKPKLLDFVRHYDPNNPDENYQNNIDKFNA